MSGTWSRLLRSTPFRLALTFAFLFVLAFVLSGAIVYQMMSADLAERLDDTIKETYAVVAATYAENDLKELVETVGSHSLRSLKKEQLFSLTDATGNRLAGNFTAAGLPDGFSMFDTEMPGVPPGAEYRAYSGPVGGNTLTVAFSLSETEELERIVLMSFGWGTLIITGLAVAGGALLASRVQRRLDGIAATMVDVSHGRLDTRIPLTGKGDDIDIVSSQVNAALDRLSALVEGMKQVSANIAHDLKTPLNRLQMILDTASEKNLSGRKIAAELAEAHAESLQINETFDALLRIAQIEAGARRARFTDVDLGEVLQTIAEIYADVAEDDGKSLSLAQPQETTDRIHGDRELLTQMFANLVENALRHCPSGTTIKLSVARQGERVVAGVADNGPGIPAEEREKVFQRLYRLDHSRSTSGSGLGLSLVRAIADLHGASITLEDCRPGLAVVVRFPLATD
ncbi:MULTISPECIES: HAMP domain-containing sensor histidine kinase [unclassified Mesorhizobium]|uniref:HAMP domain-containing sensor histidine kinase n=1 Tax=unclassified Mesorhizobium TaxID=325217 RepID=UPI000FCA3BAE|nr:MULTISPECIES: HAMP domain-containing sensor histidine kinase [unclassified Mesorhizobium]RUY93631.1 HAMP domain-containing histidine kinase [Mesorhizobium sp. M7A.F.Ca.CA.001.12.2.1]RUZ30659.1 HAMP domain-containing histidine kinase [Mesorhizobium sp. M7A.F.Ca.US.007.01.2.1]RUZ45020.1 HAMP domain-containing histidine kinase [Mesorhizobium sp. M7A.F.Ca.US.003.02.1.1]RUZ69448.1 HAMP domain-containing histidine kinase [Mesorhizobium sp. M7A.F.Ca.US.007.01.1.1]